MQTHSSVLKPTPLARSTWRHSIISLVAILAGGAMVVAIIALLWVGTRGPRLPFPSCGQCHYDLSGSIGSVDRCPECGGRFAMVGIRPPQTGGRRGALAIAGVGIAVLGFGSIALNWVTVRQQGVQSFQTTPTITVVPYQQGPSISAPPPDLMTPSLEPAPETPDQGAENEHSPESTGEDG